MEIEKFDGLNPDEGNPTMEDLEEVVGDQGDLDAATGEKGAYTPEEIRDLLKAEGDFAKIDTSRLSEEGQLLMKSFQAGLTHKLQRGAEATRRVQELETKLEELQKQAQEAPPRTVEEAFDRNPEKVMAWFDQEIERLEQVAEYDKKAEGDLHELKRTQRELVLRGMRNSRDRVSEMEEKTTKETNLVKWDAQIRRAIPDIDKIKGDLGAFAVRELNYSEEQLVKLTNPALAGEAGVHNTLSIYKAWKAMGGDKGLRNKERKPNPNDLEEPGDGFSPGSRQGNLPALKKKLQDHASTDNMAALLAEKRRLRRR